MMSRTTIDDFANRGNSAKSAKPNRSMAKLAGHPGHAHDPNHASSVMAIPPSAAMNPRLTRSMGISLAQHKETSGQIRLRGTIVLLSDNPS